MSQNSVVDVPVTSAKDTGDGVNSDLLKTNSYAVALGKFASKCGTPLTIGVQGEWGSGKTSLLNMIKESMREGNIQVKIKRKGNERLSTLDIKSADAFKVIWVNTWEHSLLKSPEECLISIIEEIIDEIAKVDGSWQTTQKAKNALTFLARGALRIGAAATLGVKGGQVADEMIGGGNNSIKALRNSLSSAIVELVGREENPVQRFVIFVDDLDRLEPSVAVKILELLKNIFNLSHCVFIVAIDYQVIVKGLKEKFGEQTPENEWEFRAFFDKIIQLPFMMPMASYDLKNYLEKLLLETGFFDKSDINAINAKSLSKVIKLTVGTNPRALKRLVNSLSLIKMQSEVNQEKKHNESEEQKLYFKQLLIALVCIQISFPKVFELLVRSPYFQEWDDSFANKVTGGPHNENKELATALSRAMEVNEEDFDEPWEQALFKIIWINGWQRNRLVEASKLLSLIKDKLLPKTGTDESQREKLEAVRKALLVEALKQTAVTAVASSEDGVFGSGREDEQEEGPARVQYWKDFREKMKGSGSCFDGVDMSPTYSGKSFSINSPIVPDNIKFTVSCTTSVVLKVETVAGTGEPADNYMLFEWFRKVAPEIEKKVGRRPHFRISKEKTSQSIVFDAPAGVKNKVDLTSDESKEIKKEILYWLRKNAKKFEESISSACSDFETRDSDSIEGIDESESLNEVSHK